MPYTTTVKNAGAIVHLVEELGDARLRCDQLSAYVAEAVRLVENSPHRDHFFEVAGHLLQAVPVTLVKLQKALQAAAFAANRIDYEELKNDLRPEKVQHLEQSLEDVRIRQIHRRSELKMITPQYVAERLRQIAATTRQFQLPQTEVAAFIAELEGTHKRAGRQLSTADALEGFAKAVEEGNKDFPRLASVLRRMIGDVHVSDALAALQEVGPKTAGASEAIQFKDLVRKKFPGVLRGSKAIDSWTSDVESVVGQLIDLLAHDKWARQRLFMVADEAREFKAVATKFRATLSAFKKVLDSNYLALAQSVNPDETKTESEWAQYKASSEEEKQSRFEEGKPADPTENMNLEDKKKWEAEKERNKDKFKKEAESWKVGADEEPPFGRGGGRPGGPSQDKPDGTGPRGQGPQTGLGKGPCSKKATDIFWKAYGSR